MTRQELSAALDALVNHTRAASLARVPYDEEGAKPPRDRDIDRMTQAKAQYDAAAAQAVAVRNQIRAATTGQDVELVRFTELAYTAERTGDDTQVNQTRTALRSAPLRNGTGSVR